MHICEHEDLCTVLQDATTQIRIFCWTNDVWCDNLKKSNYVEDRLLFMGGS